MIDIESNAMPTQRLEIRVPPSWQQRDRNLGITGNFPLDSVRHLASPRPLLRQRGDASKHVPCKPVSVDELEPAADSHAPYAELEAFAKANPPPIQWVADADDHPF